MAWTVLRVVPLLLAGPCLAESGVVKTSLWTPEALKWAVANPGLEVTGPLGKAFVEWRGCTLAQL